MDWQERFESYMVITQKVDIGYDEEIPRRAQI